MRWQWRLHVLNRSMELRWKYGEVEDEIEPGVLTDIDVPRLREVLGKDYGRLVRAHREVLRRTQAALEGAQVTPEAEVVWERSW